MTWAGLDYTNSGGIATLTFNRPEARNAITTGMFLELERCLLDIDADDTVKVVVLAGAGGHFSAGADLKPMSPDEARRVQEPAFPGDPGGNLLERSNRCMLRLHKLPKPVIASISGNALGIAASLTLAADLRIAASNARLGFIFSRIGLGPDGGASYFLRHLLGPAKALELLYLGDIIEAAEALALGLFNRVVTQDELAEQTAVLAERLAHGPSLAYAVTKDSVYRAANMSLESVLDLEARNQMVLTRSDDLKEGIQAFIERRKPEFKGS